MLTLCLPLERLGANLLLSIKKVKQILTDITQNIYVMEFLNFIHYV